MNIFGVNGKFELIGNTSVDLSKYSTTEQNDIKYVAKVPGKTAQL